MRVGYTGPGENQRQLGCAQHIERCFHICATDGWRRLYRQRHFVNVDLGLLRPHILRDLDEDRPPRAAHGGAVRHGEDPGYFGGRFHAESALAQRGEHAAVIDLQHTIAFHQAALHGSGDDHHRGGVFVGIAGGDQGVEGTRPRVHQDDPRAAGQPSLGVGHAGGNLFMAA